MELRNSLSERFGVEIPPTVTFDYPTLPALSAYIAKLTVTETTTAANVLPTVASRSPDIDDLRFAPAKIVRSSHVMRLPVLHDRDGRTIWIGSLQCVNVDLYI